MKAPGWDWQIKAAGGDSAEIYIYGDIGESLWGEESITSRTFTDNLAEVSAEYLTVRINSVGGSVSDGLAIHNAIRRHPAAVTVEIDGVAMSAASMIAMSGDTVRMASNALLMIHAPWNIAGGNAEELRKQAETLDKYAEAMANSYVRNDVTYEQALALLQDGEDHYYTAVEALEAGFIDEIGAEMKIAASGRFDLSRFPNLPAAAAAFTQPEKPIMATTDNTAATDNKAVEKTNVSDIQSAARRKERDQIMARNKQIEQAYAKCMERDGVAAIYAAQIANPDITLEQAQAALLDHMAQAAVPHGWALRIDQTVDERDKFKAGVSAAVQARMGVGKDDRANEFRGRSLAQLAESSLVVAGANTRGLTKSEIASKVLAAHTTSDFPYLMLDAANKRLQAAYEAFPSTWQMWCGVGETPDFKTVNLLRMGSFNSLDTVPEGEEYKQGTIGEEKETLTPVTKGKYIQLTRQMIINDDLQGFSRMAALLGRAAARTVNKDVYTLLNSNPTMSDSIDLFHASHSNLAGTGAAPSVITVGAGRAAMRKQMDPNSNDYLNIAPSVILSPVALEDTFNVLIASESDPAKSNSRTANPIRNMATVVSDPYLDATSATAWYLAANPMDAPLVEVHFLDGNQTPYIDSEEEFLSDAVRSKVRMDYGLAANDWRGGYKNAGA